MEFLVFIERLRLSKDKLFCWMLFTTWDLGTAKGDQECWQEPLAMPLETM